MNNIKSLINSYSNKAIFLSDFRRKLMSSKTKVWLPDITISRDPGSGGKLIANMVAKKLKWKVLDRELMTKLAHELKIPENEFGAIDEHPRGWHIDLIQSLMNPDYISDITYISHLTKIIRHIAHERQVVILGRGANHIIPREYCLRVLITASLERRIENTRKYEGMTREQARDWVKTVELHRNRFVKQYFGAQAKALKNFDLVINTDNLGLTATRDIIIAAYFRKFPKNKIK